MDQNVTVLREGYQAFATGDVEGVLARFQPDIEWRIPGPEALAGNYAGHAGVGEFFGRIAAAYDLQLRPEQFLPVDAERVLVLGRHVGAGACGPFDVPFAHVWTMRDGKAATFFEYTDTETLGKAVRKS
jgi:ketosteroid isomerase-like protein